mgnify:CR=1 FL=1
MPVTLGRSLDEARDAVARYSEATGSIWFSESIVERETYWFFPVGFIGSCGVIVNKVDLALFPMGSALSLDDCFWGHEHGFSPDRVTLRILAVHDLEQTIEFLLNFAGAPTDRNPNPRRVWIRNVLSHLPYDCPPQSLWLQIPAFRTLLSPNPFEYKILPSSSPTQPQSQL